MPPAAGEEGHPVSPRDERFGPFIGILVGIIAGALLWLGLIHLLRWLG